MQKVWEWVRDKRRTTVRKWNSSTGFGRENGALLKSGDFDQFVAVASNPALTFGSTQNVDTSVGPDANGNAQKVRKNARTCSQSARGVSGPSPVPIPRKGKSLKNQTERKSDARSSDQQQLLQIPTHHREGSFRRLKRRLTPNFKKKTQQNISHQADPEYEAELMQSSSMTTPLIICPEPEPNVAGGQSTDSLNNPASVSDMWQKQPKALGDDNPHEGMRLLLIEDDSSQMCGINNAFGSSEDDNLSRSDLDVSENRSTLGVPSSIAVEPPSSGASINTEDEDEEPFIQLEPPVDQLSADQKTEVAKLEENLAESQGQNESNLDCRVVTDVTPAQMSHSFTAPAIKSAIPVPVGSMSVKTTRRKLRFMVPQVSVDNLFAGDDYRASSMGDVSTVSSLVHSSYARGHDAPPGRRVTLPSQGHPGDYGSDDTALSPGSAGPRPTASTPTSPVPSPHAPRRGLTDTERRRASLAIRRQSNVQLVHNASGRRASTTLIPLTAAQIHLVRSLWRQIYLTKGPTVIGQTVMHRLFFKCPKVKEQFRNCPMPSNYSNHDSFSKQHCKSMAEIVDQVVENLDDLEMVVDDLERIGRVHAQTLNGNLSSKMWNSVAETFIDCTLEWGDRRCRSETVRKAWALIIAFMIEKIKHGHLDERKQILVMRSTIASLERVALAQNGANGGSKCPMAHVRT